MIFLTINSSCTVLLLKFIIISPIWQCTQFLLKSYGDGFKAKQQVEMITGSCSKPVGVLFQSQGQQESLAAPRVTGQTLQESPTCPCMREEARKTVSHKCLLSKYFVIIPWLTSSSHCGQTNLRSRQKTLIMGTYGNVRMLLVRTGTIRPERMVLITRGLQ